MNDTPRRRPGRPPQVSADQIVTAAIGLIDDDGLDALTMRALGARLGVAAMSLYRHVPHRDAVLAAVVNRLVTAALADLEPQPSWPEAATGFARAYRAMLLSHPNAVPLLATHPVDVGAVTPLLAGVLDRFAADGIAQDTALIALQSIGVYTLGHALAQVGSPPDRTADPAAAEYYDQWFAAGLRAMVKGFRP
ncbi:TetR/AcrR family transcriptional regulator [Amycolatopsis silviterrae]|uniref:TetR/AcrR family transcriptional regulator n=1 Tax=Amycolatopsis silviterrae TaxID=1656914 RepID=A0ABW5HJ67_9PSEU